MSVRINCIELLGLHHLFYKGAAGPLGFQGCATPGAASPGAATPSATSPGAGPLGLQECGPLGLHGCASPGAASPRAGPRGSTPPINVTPHLSIEAPNSTAIPLL
jgi:hypothetical protein